MTVENTQYEVAEVEPVGLAKDDTSVYRITVRPAFVPTKMFLKNVCETTEAEPGVSAKRVVSTASATQLLVKIMPPPEIGGDDDLDPDARDLLEESAQYYRAQQFAHDLCEDLNEIEHKKAPSPEAQ